MKVVYTEEALRDLDEIQAFIESNYPTIPAAFKKRLTAVAERIGRCRWSEVGKRSSNEQESESSRSEGRAILRETCARRPARLDALTAWI